jgi:hypothetical protein
MLLKRSGNFILNKNFGFVKKYKGEIAAWKEKASNELLPARGEGRKGSSS